MPFGHQNFVYTWIYTTLTLPHVFNKEKKPRIVLYHVCQLNHKRWALLSNCQLTDGNTLCLVIAVNHLLLKRFMINMRTLFQDCLQDNVESVTIKKCIASITDLDPFTTATSGT